MHFIERKTENAERIIEYVFVELNNLRISIDALSKKISRKKTE